MTKNKDLIAERLKAMNESNQTLKQEKPNVVQNIATGEEEKPDFMKMAGALEAQKPSSINDNHVKDTIYIRQDLFNAMQSLCKAPGDKKFHVNAAYEMYLTKVYKEMDIDLSETKEIREPIKLKKHGKKKKK